MPSRVTNGHPLPDGRGFRRILRAANGGGPQTDAWGCGMQLTPRVGAGLRIVEELDAR